MAASNKQPTGSRPGPGTAHTHGPNQAGKPGTGHSNPGPGQGIAPHGTPKPVGNNKKNPLH